MSILLGYTRFRGNLISLRERVKDIISQVMTCCDMDMLDVPSAAGPRLATVVLLQSFRTHMLS